MKPLVYWCRWHDATLRLMGRDETAVWGELAFPDTSKRFHFELATAVLTIHEPDGPRTFYLDEMGVATPASQSGEDGD